MRLSGKQIVDVSAEDARELRAYAVSMTRGYMNHTRRPSELLTEYQKNNPRQPAMSGLVDFMSMVALALADAPKDALTVNVEPFKGILADVTTLPKHAPAATPIASPTQDQITYDLATCSYTIESVKVDDEDLRFAREHSIRTDAVDRVMAQLMPILQAKWPTRGEYLLTCTPRAGSHVQEYSSEWKWAVRTCLWRKEAGAVFYSRDGSGVVILRKNDSLVRVMEGEFETAAFDLNHPHLGNLHKVTV